MRTKSVIHQSERCCQFDNADDDEHDLRQITLKTTYALSLLGNSG